MTYWLITTIHLLSGKPWMLLISREFSINCMVAKENKGIKPKTKRQCASKSKNKFAEGSFHPTILYGQSYSILVALRINFAFEFIVFKKIRFWIGMNLR